MTLPFCTSTLAGGWANLHSVSWREHLLRWNSRQTSSCSQRESLPFSRLLILTMAAIFETILANSLLRLGWWPLDVVLLKQQGQAGKAYFVATNSAAGHFFALFSWDEKLKFSIALSCFCFLIIKTFQNVFCCCLKFLILFFENLKFFWLLLVWLSGKSMQLGFLGCKQHVYVEVLEIWKYFRICC